MSNPREFNDMISEPEAAEEPAADLREPTNGEGPGREPTTTEGVREPTNEG